MNSMMKILIIEPGLPPAPLKAESGFYPAMFKRLVSSEIKGAHYDVCSVICGDKLPNAGEYDGIVILGSPHSVYEDLPWINELVGFVKNAANHKIPQIGICFGHQLIAKAMGGYVAKAPQGWGIGRHSYEISHENISDFCPEICKNKKALNLLVSHQDQVLEKPEAAKVVAASDFTPNAVLHYEAQNILSCQAHPEFNSSFAYELIASRRGTRFPEEFADKALSDINEPVDGTLLAQMIAGHLKAAHQQRKAA
jgi:GMP synthase-like glutamine amidotransferase